MDKMLLDRFACPPNAYRGKPFWSWNGRLEKDELLRQIHVLQEMGCGGFFMHSRTGLATEYLGDEWFDLINACADEAEQLGMEAWLYDEDRWPSGTAGGMVTKDPRCRTKYLRMTPVPASAFAWDDSRWKGMRPELGLVAAFACDLDGLTCTNWRRIFPETAPADYAGQTVLVCTTEEMYPQTFYNGETYLDTINRAATDAFIAITHDRYKTECGDRFGKSIKGVFTDEPHHGMVMDMGFGLENPDQQWLVPWTYDFFDEFEKRVGYSLVERLPELYLWPDGEKVTEVKWHYNEVLEQLFLENWAKPLNDWCEANDLILTGHVLHEDTLVNQTVPSGSVMRYYEHMGYPGVDILTEGNRKYWVVKQLESAARQLGKTWLLSELYGCTGWQMSFESHKAVGDWQALFGINLRCKHLSWYTMEGEAKRDFPASILHQSTWYKEYERIETYFSRIHVLMNEGKACCELLVVNPVESAWAQIYPGWAAMLGAADADVQQLESAYEKLFHWLCGAQIDFDYGDEDFIKRMGRVDTSGATPLLRIGEAAYKAVIVSGMTTIRSTSVALLATFVEAGGTVIFTGEVPPYVDARPSSTASELAHKATCVPFERHAVTDACDAVIAPTLRVERDGDTLGEVFCQARRSEDRTVVMALNVNREQGYSGAKVRIRATGVVEEWDCFTGKRHVVPAESRDGWLEFETDFAPAQEHLYVVTRERDASIAELPRDEECCRQAIAGPYDYRLDEPNSCVLDRARFRLNDGAWREELEILQLDRSIRTELDMPLRGGEMLQPWFTQKQEHSVKAQLEMAFDFDIETMPVGPLELVVESPADFSIRFNEHLLDAPENDGWWVDICMKRIPVPAQHLKQGANTVTLRSRFTDAVNLEALYVLGNFGVRIDGAKRTLTALPERLAAGDATTQGLPFYTGRIRYQVDPASAPADADRVFLATPEFEGACVQVKCGDKKPRMIPWQPYETDVTDLVRDAQHVLEIEVVLTRRNVFGPLHQIPLKAPGYGPDNFTTSGEAFSNEYMLYPSGLLSEPEWIGRKQR